MRQAEAIRTTTASAGLHDRAVEAKPVFELSMCHLYETMRMSGMNVPGPEVDRKVTGGGRIPSSVAFTSSCEPE